MNWVHPLSLWIGAWVLAFAQAWFTGLRPWVHVQPDLLPGLVIYAALYAGLPTTVGVAVAGGVGTDLLSSGALGLGAVPLLVLGVMLHRRRDLILRDSPWAQVCLGGVGAAGVMVGSMVLLYVIWPLVSDVPRHPVFHPERASGLFEMPPVGLSLVWQVLVTGVVGGLATPVLFWLYRWVDATCNYQPAPVVVRRGDREIERGRT